MSKSLRLLFSLSAIGVAAGCHCTQPTISNDGGSKDGGRSDGGGGDGGSGNGLLVIQPLNSMVTVTTGQPVPTVQFTATVNGTAVSAVWLVDRGEIGSIDGTGLFTPTGNVAGLVNVSAEYGALANATTVTVKIANTQIGDPAYGNVGTIGAGGYGGVGGNGPGGPVTPGQVTTLSGTPTQDATVQILYPYDQTVWARGLLAPLLQWFPSTHNFDSVYVHVQETNFEYKGYFGPPNSNPFVNLPIPQAAWDQMTRSALPAETVAVTLVFGEGTAAYGPYALSWKVAPATLRGTVYYISYGTSLVQNSVFTTCCPGPAIGGATLSIQPGANAPTLVAGTSSSDTSGCRVCHTVSANGGFLVTQHGDNYSQSSLYALNSGNTETVLSKTNIGFSALYPDGTMLFSESGGLSPGGVGAWGDTTSQLYSLPSTALLAANGLPSGLQATLPSFSPDGKHVTFVFWGGAGADQRSVASMDFDATSLAFSNLQTLVTPAAGPAAWPSYLPTNTGVVYEVETQTTSEYGFTRCTTVAAGCQGVHGELWWVDAASKTATRLDAANGKGYLPTSSATNHTDDTTLNYEPTVNPLVSGGYAWIVFTSRRLYGNVATIDPFLSDPRDYDWQNQITTKKLWVAAVDQNAAPGTDPSHPAFYLPGQELHAGNSRGFWSLEPCRKDGQACDTGDECCGGYCEPGDGGLACSSIKPICSQVGDKCTVDADCCGVNQGVTCQNGYCASPTLK